MKKLPFFLALSLALNAALLVIFFLRPIPAASVAATPPAAPSPTTAAGFNSAQLTALRSGDLAQLKAADLPDEVARNLLLGRAYARLQTRLGALRKATGAGTKYWRSPASRSGSPGQSREQRAEMNRAQRDYADAVSALSGADPVAAADSRYDYLPAAKRDQLRRIEQDYGDMESETNSEINNVQLPSDREKFRLLHQEREHDIAAALSPEELEQYNLHSSPTANNISNRFGDAIQTEDDYRKIFALQKIFDDRFNARDVIFPGPQAKEFFDARMDAETKLMDDMRVALGAETFAAIQRASDWDYKSLSAVATRLNLPPGTADAVFAARDTYAEQSQQINQDAALSPEDRRVQFKNLADKARADLQVALGAEGAEAYGNTASWLNLLKNGNAFSTNPKNAPGSRRFVGVSVYPVPPPHPPAPPKG